MKKVLQIATAAIVGASMFVGVASAAVQNCTIVNTGPASVNVCDDTVTNNSFVFCTNNVILNSTNVQAATSGVATVATNTVAGGAVSGTAANTNLNNIAVQLGCGPQVASVPTPPATPTTPETPAAAAQVAKPKGSVKAGAGGASADVSVASLIGVAASVGTLGAGVALRKKAFQS